MQKSIYDIKIKSWDGREDFMSQYVGKVSLLFDCTGACGNDPQFLIIEKIYQKYKDQGFAAIAIPVGEYSCKGVAYGKFADGLECGEDARDFAVETYNVTYDFSEKINSDPSPNNPEAKYTHLQLPEGEEPHELFKLIRKFEAGDKYMFGNFEKYLIDKNGQVIKHYHNGALLDYCYDHHLNSDIQCCGTAEEEYIKICKDIEDLLSQ
jgi:glutathione peroxidase